MGLLPKKLSRTIVYVCVFVGLPFLIFQYVIIPIKIHSTLLNPSTLSPQQVSEFPGVNDGKTNQISENTNDVDTTADKDTQNKEGYLSQLSDAIWKKVNEVSLWNYDMKSTIITDISITTCYFGPFVEYCLGKNTKTSTTNYASGNEKKKKNNNNKESKYTVYKKLIEKDINQSKNFKWVGTSKYMVISYTTLEDTLTLEDSKITIVSDVSIDSPKDLVLEDDYTSIEKLNLIDKNHIFVVKTELDYKKLGKKKYTVLSDVDILFGDDCVEPRPDWNLDTQSGPMIKNKRYPSFLTLKYLEKNDDSSKDSFSTSTESGNSGVSKKIQQKDDFDSDLSKRLTLNSNGNFKILQIADLHFSVGHGICQHEFPTQDKNCKADPKTLNFLNEVLDSEKPDLVVFTGDQIMGDQCKQDSISAILKVVEPLIRRKIPYAMIWGNHDDEGSLTRWELSEFVSQLPYSTFMFSSRDNQDTSFGVGNYIHQVFTSSGNPAITLYFLDSHKYSSQPKNSPGYDWIKEEQWKFMVDYYATKIKPSLQSYSRIPLSLAFFHIPLPEYFHLASTRNPGQQNKFTGSWKEGCTAPKYDTHGVDALVAMNVQVASCGHDHCNDFCLMDDSSSKDKNIWLCYGGGAGEGGYAGYGGTERRVRVFDIDTMSGNIHSWKLLHSDVYSKIDFQLLVNGGTPV